MNFLCDQCKQKYHVADEKVRGRAVTRFKCKKCGHVIELRMAGASEFPAGSAPIEDLSAARELPPSVPPPAPTGVRPGSATASVPLPSAPGVRSAPRPTGTGLPTAARLPTAPASVPKPPTSAPGVSRPGGAAPLPTRSPASASAATVPKPAPSPVTRGATGTGLPTAGALGVSRPAPVRGATGTGLPTAGAIGSATGSNPSARSTGLGGPSSLRSGLAGGAGGSHRSVSSASMLLNASETGWYAGVRDVPVGPLTRGELATRIESGDITPDSLVWREGLDDWRPLRSVDELSDLVRSAAQKMSDGLIGTMGRRDPGPSKVVPLQRTGPAAAGPTPAPAASRSGFESPESDGDVPSTNDDEPTRMTALADLVAKAEQAGLLTEKPRVSSPPPAPATASARPQSAMPSVRPAPARPAASISSPPSATASASPLLGPPAVNTGPIPLVAPAPPSSSATASPRPGATTSAPFAAAPFASSPLAASPLASAPPATASAPIAAVSSMGLAGPSDPTQHLGANALASATVAQPAQRERRIGGLPIGAWVMMLGVGVTGVAIGLAFRGNPTPAAPSAPTTTQARTSPTEPPPIQRTVGQDINLAANDLHPAAPTPAPTEPAAAHPAGGHPSGGTHPASGAAATAPAHSLSAAQRAQLAQLDQGGLGAIGPAPPVGAQLSTPSAASSGPVGLQGQQRAQAIIERFSHSTVVHDCWQNALRMNPAHATERVNVTLDVSGTGRVSHVSVDGTGDPQLVTCIRNRASGQNFGAGEGLSASAAFNLAPGG